MLSFAPISDDFNPVYIQGLRRLLALPESIGLAVCPIDDLCSETKPGLRVPIHLAGSVEKRKREYLAGRVCARNALRAAGHPGDAYPGMGDDRLPVWPDRWLGSISHSGRLAAAVAAPQSACEILGLDLQQQSGQGDLAGVQSLVAYPDEIQTIQGLELTTRLLLLFSAKESLYKALYPTVRTFQEFDAARVVGFDTHGLELQLVHDWSECWTAGMRIAVRYAVLDDYVCTVVSLPSLPGQ